MLYYFIIDRPGLVMRQAGIDCHFNQVFRGWCDALVYGRGMVAVDPVARKQIVAWGKPPVTVSIDEGKILRMIILVTDQVVEDHQTVHLPQLSNAMGKGCADLKYMAIVNA